MAACFECGDVAQHRHHVVPRVLGGTRTVDLCGSCHGLVHDRRFLNHVQLTRAGLERAKANGKRLGRPVILPQSVRERIVAERAMGRSLPKIAQGLMDDGVPTARGGQRWYPAVVRKVLLSVQCDAEVR